jgi:hypothetical protein
VKNAHANTPHPPEPNAEKLAYFAEASRMSTERSFVKLQVVEQKAPAGKSAGAKV